jgi:hypothetical protein
MSDTDVRVRHCHRARPNIALAIASALLLAAPAARALPSFAQQTGLPCVQCHTVGFGPALTPYGREFKLNGYVFGDAGSFVPLALMVQGGYTHTRKEEPDPPAPHTDENDNVTVDQTSLFYAGRISQHVGAFAQVTYTGSTRKTHWDNTDIRYARPLIFGDTGVVLGVSVNNNPTIQDLWNSTPGWGFPYIASALAPVPAAAPLITGLAQSVLGASGYAMINQRVYLEIGGYRGLSNRWLGNVGLSADASSHLSGLAPYWRAALQFGAAEQQWSVGTFGMQVRVQPDPTVPDKDRYTDIGLDATYTRSGAGPHALAANVAVVHESRHLAASFNAGASDAVTNQLTASHADLTYAYDKTWVGSASVFDTSGTTNAALYAPAPVGGSKNGSPDSRGYSLQLEWIPFGKQDSYARPWLNLRLGLQYVAYSKFNGDSSNYDGSGRSARDNNTLFTYFWLIG